MTLNSSVKVQNLNADSLDGLDASELFTRGYSTADGSGRLPDPNNTWHTLQTLPLSAGNYFVFGKVKLYHSTADPFAGGAWVDCVLESGRRIDRDWSSVPAREHQHRSFVGVVSLSSPGGVSISCAKAEGDILTNNVRIAAVKIGGTG